MSLEMIRMTLASASASMDQIFNDRAITRQFSHVMPPKYFRLFNYVLNNTANRDAVIKKATDQVKIEEGAANKIRGFYKNNPIEDRYKHFLRMILYEETNLLERAEFMIWKLNYYNRKLPQLSEELVILLKERPKRGFLEFFKQYELTLDDIALCG